MKRKLRVLMFGQEDTVSVEFFNQADKELVYNIIKENIILKAKKENYSPISEPVVIEHQYLKQRGLNFIPVPNKDEADFIIFHTTVKVVRNKLPKGYKPTNTRTIERF